MAKRRSVAKEDSDLEEDLMIEAAPKKRVKSGNDSLKPAVRANGPKARALTSKSSGSRKTYARSGSDPSVMSENSGAEGHKDSLNEDSSEDEEDEKVLQDVIDYDLDVLFCDISPGQKSLEVGHHFGNPLNHFWHCLHRSGLTSSELSPYQENALLRARIGATELVPVSTLRDPSKEDMVAAFPTLLAKVRKYRPRIVCFTGLMMADNLQKAINKKYKTPRGTKVPKSGLGIQAYKVTHEGKGKVRETVFYAIPSVQGKVTAIQKEGKVEVFKELRKTLKQLKAGRLETDSLRDIMAF